MIIVTTCEVSTRYSDGSGIEKAVRYDGHKETITFEKHGSDVTFDASEADWLIAALMRVRAEIAPPPAAATRERG